MADLRIGITETRDSTGVSWYWSVSSEDDELADGDAATEDQARRFAEKAADEWLEKTRPAKSYNYRYPPLSDGLR